MGVASELHKCSIPKYSCNIAKAYRKGEEPVHFSLKHRMSLETTLVTSLPKHCEIRLPLLPEVNHLDITLL